LKMSSTAQCGHYVAASGCGLLASSSSSNNL
jgi:hypothetical protein